VRRSRFSSAQYGLYGADLGLPVAAGAGQGGAALVGQAVFAAGAAGDLVFLALDEPLGFEGVQGGVEGAFAGAQEAFAA